MYDNAENGDLCNSTTNNQHIVNMMFTGERTKIVTEIN
jgi:hypothetical protein